ncbi:hypothetical protein PNOK_0608100 [Pyrrhoderma noxium]|uniref:Sc15 n=1 Tax=Pyrrhoderma noxium TaxID=2282107 RepID=A0A286UDM2_9AGAM|nr:hypothetical protein PNOK_0608100 [Pyrrhoderma noxium]
MRSFTILSLAATAAFSLFSSAAPIFDTVNGAVDDAITTVKNTNVDNTVGSIADKQRRALPSVPQILNTLITDLTPVVSQISALEGSTVSRATASPLFTQVTDIVSTAVNDVQQLVGAPVGTVLASVDGTVTVAVSDVAVLASKALSLVLNSVGSLVTVVGADVDTLGPELSAVGSVLASLVTGVLGVVNDLLPELLPLVVGLVPTVSQLAFTTLAGALSLAL